VAISESIQSAGNRPAYSGERPYPTAMSRTVALAYSVQLAQFRYQHQPFNFSYSRKLHNVEKSTRCHLLRIICSGIMFNAALGSSLHQLRARRSTASEGVVGTTITDGGNYVFQFDECLSPAQLPSWLLLRREYYGRAKLGPLFCFQTTSGALLPALT